MADDKNRGLYGKYLVERTDGSTEFGGKHEYCDFFVLDITHDPHAIPALRAYAESARRDGYELLADDILKKVETRLENAAPVATHSSGA
jgi:hypothetical protein